MNRLMQRGRMGCTRSLVRRVHTLGVMNVGLQRAPLDHPIMAEFVEATPAVNALARSSPGFE